MKPAPANATVCHIVSSQPELLAALVAIARACAADIGHPLIVKTGPLRATPKESVITLHLPAELAASQHPVWCLACRLACFCPTARVSVFVHGEVSFRQKERPIRKPRAA